MTDSSVISTRGLSRTYEQGGLPVHALQGVDLNVAEGEFTALVGPSGSGKSTLLNLVGCLDTPSEGTVSVHGRQVTGLSRSESANFRLAHVGFVFQAYNLLPVLTARENAEYTLVLQGKSAAERRAIVDPLFARVGLEGMEDRRPHELSGGQQQRVAVVRAIATSPAVVLADEPTAKALLDLMLELNRERGTTFLFASHDPEVMARARRIVHLRDGQIERDEVR